MATNYVQKGHTLTLTAPSGGIKSGEGRMYGELFGIAQHDADQATPVECAVVGVWTLPKVDSVVSYSEGAAVFWDDSGKLCKATGAGYFKIGVAVIAAGATDSVVVVRLDGHSLTAVAGG